MSTDVKLIMILIRKISFSILKLFKSHQEVETNIENESIMKVKNENGIISNLNLVIYDQKHI